jgi:hypothetical protein
MRGSGRKVVEGEARMTAQDRQRLEALGLSAEVIARAEEVLRVWEVETLFVTCSLCGQACISPDVRKRQYRRKTPPAELFDKAPLGFRDDDCDIVCWPCDDARWQ